MSNIKDNQTWYRLKIRKKGLLQEAKQKLSDYSISFLSLADNAYPKSCLQCLASRYELLLYVNADLETITDFLEKENINKIYKLTRDNHNVPVVYDDITVRQTNILLSEYNGEFRNANDIPTKAKECTINYLNLCDFKGFYQKLQKAPIDKFYITLLEKINIFIPVPKGTYKEPKDKTESEIVYRKKTRWMILRTYHEEDWYDILCQWNIDMADAIRRDEARACFPFLPKRIEKDKNGKEHTQLLCRGYLFVKTTIDNMTLIGKSRYGIPNIYRAVMKSNSDGKMKPVYINEHAMTDFMFATSIDRDELEYDTFDFCIDEHVVYTNTDSAFYGRIGKLSRKGKDLYLSFSLSNQLDGNILIPAIKVDVCNIRKLNEEEVREYESDK